jgi:Abi-like protein
MPRDFSTQEQLRIPATLSTPRFATYLAACNNDTEAALRLYGWNARVASAFLFPLHLFEICIRNAVANAAAVTYSATWPWVANFERSLPKPYYPHFSPHQEILKVRKRHENPPSTGRVIADLKFAFWVSMFTLRHEPRLWRPYIKNEFPNAPAGMAVEQLRIRIYNVSEAVRQLRNRIAHHEPIFGLDLITSYESIEEIIGYRCRDTLVWMRRAETVTNFLLVEP